MSAIKSKAPKVNPIEAPVERAIPDEDEFVVAKFPT